jgi:hypothetical protein
MPQLREGLHNLRARDDEDACQLPATVIGPKPNATADIV